MQAQAQTRAQQVAQLIADANNKPKEQPKGEARNPVVTLIPSGDYEAWRGSVQKGQMIPDNSVEGGLKPAGPLTVPALPDAPAKAVVVFIINIDPNGNVAPGRKTALNSAQLTPARSQVSRSWIEVEIPPQRGLNFIQP
jgi:hypothetical protein